jgi:hypothetical protein
MGVFKARQIDLHRIEYSQFRWRGLQAGIGARSDALDKSIDRRLSVKTGVAGKDKHAIYRHQWK